MGGRGRGFGSRLDSLAKWLLRFRIFSIPASIVSNSRIAWSMISRVDRVRVRRQKDRISAFDLPNHVSIIMDGNRRFAWNRSLGT